MWETGTQVPSIRRVLVISADATLDICTVTDNKLLRWTVVVTAKLAGPSFRIFLLKFFNGGPRKIYQYLSVFAQLVAEANESPMRRTGQGFAAREHMNSAHGILCDIAHELFDSVFL